MVKHNWNSYGFWSWLWQNLHRVWRSQHVFFLRYVRDGPANSRATACAPQRKESVCAAAAYRRHFRHGLRPPHPKQAGAGALYGHSSALPWAVWFGGKNKIALRNFTSSKNRGIQRVFDHDVQTCRVRSLGVRSWCSKNHTKPALFTSWSENLWPYELTLFSELVKFPNCIQARLLPNSLIKPFWTFIRPFLKLCLSLVYAIIIFI